MRGVIFLGKPQKKVLLLMSGPLRKKELIFFQRSKIFTTIKVEGRRGGGELGLNGPAIKRRTFFAASLSDPAVKTKVFGCFVPYQFVCLLLFVIDELR